MRTKIISKAIIIAAITGLALCHSARAADKTVELNYSMLFPAAHAHTVLIKEWADEIAKQTNGAVKFNIFPGNTLTPADQAYDGVVKGIADAAMVVASYTKGRFPLTEVIDLPLGYTSSYQATHLAKAYLDKFNPKEFSDVKILYVMAHGPGLIHTTKPVATAEDLKGMKIRSTGTTSKIITSLGGTPVAFPLTEAYDAMQKGVVEGIICPPEALKGFRFAEVLKYTTIETGAAYSSFFCIVMNKQKWEALPKDVQAKIDRISAEYAEKTAAVWEKIEREGLEYGAAKGMKIITLSPEEDKRWATMVQPILNDYLAQTKAKGLPGDVALKFCQEWLAKNK